MSVQITSVNASTSNAATGLASLSCAKLPSIESGGMLRRAGMDLYRICRDTWDVVRWTRAPLEIVRSVIPLPPRFMDIRVLNQGSSGEPAHSPGALSAVLSTMKNVLVSEALVDGRVEYGRLPHTSAYAELCEQSRLLNHVLPEALNNDAERKAFWLNVYNVLSLHGVVALGIRRSAMEIPSFFARVSYLVGPFRFSLDDISNGVLRRGSPRPGLSRPQFDGTDPRAAYWPERVDPRIHGALVCVSASCPPVAYYSADDLDDQLDMASENFVRQLVHIDERRRRLELPLQFYYYARDFGGPVGVAEFLLRHSCEPDRAMLRHAFADGWKLRWHAYDWGLNSVV